MTAPNYMQVEGWLLVVVQWLFRGCVWLQNWTLEGAGLHRESHWSFTGLLQVPFSEEDAAQIQRGRRGIWDARERGDADWNERHIHVSTQLAVGPPLGPADPPAWDGWRPEARDEPWALQRGPAVPDVGDLYPGVGLAELERRMRRFTEERLRGRLLTWSVGQAWYEWRCFTVFFRMVLPYSDPRSWRLEGNGMTHMAYAMEHHSHPADIRRRSYANVGTQTDSGICGDVCSCNVEQAAEWVLEARTRAGIPRHNEVEWRAATRRL